jgi:hypothetical protein
MFDRTYVPVQTDSKRADIIYVIRQTIYINKVFYFLEDFVFILSYI